MLNILVVIGTRPEAIKLSPIVLELQKHSDKIYVEICITAQHRSLLDDVLINFNITSDHDLDLMSDNQTLEEISSKSLTGISSILKQRSFDWILVQGDTSTALSASLSGFYNRVKVGHIEAGLRTYNKWEPYPEEINRQLISKIADLHFAPTLNAKNYLSLEGVEEETIIVTGNTVVDSLAIASDSQPSKHIQNILDTNHPNKKIIAITAHRRENFGKPLTMICEAIKKLANKYHNECHFIYPVHPNPNVQGTAYNVLNNISNISLIEPLDYFDFIHLLKQSFLIITDSGGIQEEAPSLQIPVFILRNNTERTEGIQNKVGLILGTDKENIITEVSKVIDSESEYHQYIQAANPYGDGQASTRIVNKLLSYPYSEFVES